MENWVVLHCLKTVHIVIIMLVSMVQPLELQHLICLKVKEKPNQQPLLTGKNKYAIKETTQNIIIHVILTIIPYKVLL